MNTEETNEQTKTILARISPQLNRRVEALIAKHGYRNRSSFFEEAVRRFVEAKEAELNELTLQPQN